MAQRTEKNPPYGWRFTEKIVDDITELFELSGGFLTTTDISATSISSTDLSVSGVATFSNISTTGTATIGATLSSSGSIQVAPNKKIKSSNVSYTGEISFNNTTANEMMITNGDLQVRLDNDNGILRLYSIGDIQLETDNDITITPQNGLSLVTSKITAASLPTYADNAAAVAGGLAAGRIYKTATGELRIVV